MKNQLKTRLFLFLFSLAMFTNCSKKDDINPANIADKISGNYTMTLLAVNGQSLNLPYNQGGEQLNGTIVISKVSTTEILFTYTLNSVISGIKNQKSDSGNFDIKQNGSVIELYEVNSTTKVGALSGTILSIDSGGTKINANRN
jgi:hypothetical protein